MINKSWTDKLQSQALISEEQLLVLGGVKKVDDLDESSGGQSRVLKVMDRMLKIGSDLQSPLNKQENFFRIKGVKQSNIFTTGKQSKIKIAKEKKKS